MGGNVSVRVKGRVIRFDCKVTLLFSDDSATCSCILKREPKLKAGYDSSKSFDKRVVQRLMDQSLSMAL